ncbi:chymotrypsin-like protease CTRL-1, partial [Dreissena polymorpha]|uniref:chymotrypsin-like protease CTRL-1 n=1 Tax=Dreissena polymorpha TaxID=45954 RepID=UPI002264C7C5
HGIYKRNDPDDNECKSNWDTVYDSSAHVCIKPRDTSFCKADFGNKWKNVDENGLLVCFRGSKPVLAGLASWGEEGCDRSFPDVYTRVSTYRSWLRKTMGILVGISDNDFICNSKSSHKKQMHRFYSFFLIAYNVIKRECKTNCRLLYG